MPYNKYFINCVANNLLGVLISSDANLSALPWSMPFAYRLLQPAYSNVYDGVDPVLLRQGRFVLQLEPQNWLIQSKMENWFYIHEQQLMASDPHAIIQSLLDEEYYVFVDVDRFHMKGGPEYQCRSRVHPTFIHGYDKGEGKYFLIEDCVRLGTFAPYEIDFKDFVVAYSSAKEKSIPLLRAYKRKKSVDEWKWTGAEWLENLATLLEETSSDLHQDGSPESILVVRTGLSCIQTYAESMHVVIPAISVTEADLLNPATLPFQFHKRTEEIIEHFMHEGILPDVSPFLEPIRVLKREWGTYRNQMLKYIFNKEQNQDYRMKPEFLGKLSSLMSNIYTLEKQCYTGIVERLESQFGSGG